MSFVLCARCERLVLVTKKDGRVLYPSMKPDDCGLAADEARRRRQQRLLNEEVKQ